MFLYLKLFKPANALCMAFCAMFVMLAPMPSNAAEQNHIFTIFRVDVDVTAQNAREARAQALEQAQTTAFWRLLRKISPEDDLALRAPLSPLEIRDHVSGIVVRDERTSARRYIATFDISFNKPKILEYMGQNNLAYTELTGGPLLLIPIYEYGGVSALFDGVNPWLQTFKTIDIQNHLYKLILPKGDFEDQLLMGNIDNIAEQDEGNKDRFQKLNQKYKSNDLLLLHVWWGDTTLTEPHNLHYSYQRGLTGKMVTGTIIAALEDTPENILAKAAETILTELDLNWRTQTLTTFGAFNEIEVFIKAQNAEQWVDILERLKATPIVRSIKYEKIAVPISMVKITYGGVFEQFRLVLDAVGLNLREEYNGWYVEKNKN